MSKDQQPDRPQPERPRVEPEILPPERSEGPPRPAGVFVRFDQLGGTHRVFIARPSLSSVILAGLIIALVVALVFLLLASLVLFWIPIVVGVIVLLLLTGYARYGWWRLQAWLSRRG